MKASLLSLILLGGLLSSGAAVAQNTLANGTFESWVRTGIFNVPAQWITSDQVVYPVAGGRPLLIRGIARSEDVHGGQFAACLRFRLASWPFREWFTGLPVPALLLLGTDLPTSIGLLTIPKTQEDFIKSRPGGIPFTARPAAMQFWYKYTGATTETGHVGLLLTNGDQIIGQTSMLLTGSVTEYTRINLPITYDPAFASLTPEILRIFFVVGTGTAPSETAELFIDDVTLPLTVTSNRNPQLDAALVLYPNPSASGDFSLASLQKPGVATAPYTITDAAGRVVQRQGAAPVNAASGRRVSLLGQPAGVYLLRLDTEEGTVTRKLLIQ